MSRPKPSKGPMVAILAGLLSAGCSVFGIRGEEQPAYTVQRTLGPIEIRRYGPRLAAETTVDAPEMQARSTGFQRLAAYIFGANDGRKGIAMTAPVAQATTAQSTTAQFSTAIAMTAPVDQARTPSGWQIRFFMPAKYTMDTIPRPSSPDIRLVTVPAETVAILRYTGLPTTANVAGHQADLLAAARQAGLQPEGDPFTWFYDPPWTLPPLRRNEAVVRLPG